MIRHDCIQGTEEWLQARCGIPTASEFHKILTPKTLKPSAQADGYVYQLLAEIQCGPQENRTSAAMDRGTMLEPEAVAWYEFTQGVTVDRVGFITNDAGTVGCSPDGLVGDDGGLECKCLTDANHMRAVFDPKVDADYTLQVQGGLWLSGREWWDLCMYHPILPPVVRRQFRDEKIIQAIAHAAANVTMALAGMRAKLGI